MQELIPTKRLAQKLLVVSIFIGLFGCASISQFDQYAYVQTTSLKVDALQVMDMAVDEFNNHHDEVLNSALAISRSS